VPNELIRKILEAGVCAPSGGNMQRWRFLVIRDPKVKETVGALYKRAWDEQVAPRYRSGGPAPGTSRERFLRLLNAAEYLAAHIHEAPVWIVPCLEGGTPTRTSGSSIYPAVQNMLLAARALGLGATLTTLYLQFEKEAEAALGLPPNVHSYALLPIGYPMGRFGPVRRVALADVVYEDRWGQTCRVADLFFSLRVGQPGSRLSEHHEARGVAMGMHRRVIPRKVSLQVGTDSILTLHPA
jgi:nitroreductase